MNRAPTVLVVAVLLSALLSARQQQASDAGDFVERLLACNRWSGRFGDSLGHGPLLEIPVNCESYNLAYVPAVLDAAGLDPPTTWAEYFSTARAVVERPGKSIALELGQPAPQPDVARRRVLGLQAAGALERGRDVEVGFRQQQLPGEHRSVQLPRRQRRFPRMHHREQ